MFSPTRGACWRSLAGRRNVVVVPMGEQVLAARILALREGSALTYAAVAEATAPGQLSLDALRRVYRLGSGRRPRHA